MSSLRSAIDSVGGVAECARICGISKRGVYKWIHRNSLPRTEYTGETHHAERMAAASGGAFTAKWLLEHAAPSAVDTQVSPSEPSVTPTLTR